MLIPSRRLVARIALFAMLFSAVSPALAALRFYGNAEVLANIVSVHPADHPSTEHQHHNHAKSEGHDVYCSFCLDMASVQALRLAGPHLPLHLVSTEAPSCALGQSADAADLYSRQHPQAPPLILV